MAYDHVAEVIKLSLAGKFTVQHQVSDFDKTALLCQLFDRIAAVKQFSLVTIHVGQLALTAGSRKKARIKSEITRLAEEAADINGVRSEC